MRPGKSAVVLTSDPKRFPRDWRAQLHARGHRFQRSVPARDVADCAAVLVYNDHSADSVTLLREALALRALDPGLPIAVLTPMPANEEGVAALINGLCAPGENRPVAAQQMPALLREGTQWVKTEHSDDAVSFVYEA